MKKLTCMVIILITVAYIVIGGIVFHVLEHDNEKQVRQDADGLFLNFIANNTCVSVDELRDLLRTTLAAYSTGHLVSNQTASDDSSNWDYYSSIFFAITVVTTIGYGNISPSTLAGRIFCTVFAILGIPLFLMTAVGIGNSLHTVVKKAQKCCFQKDHDGNVTKSAKICGGLFYVFLGLGLFVCVPSVIFMFVEGWTFLEGGYYCIITLTTVGFGDYVAGVDMNSKYSGFRGIYRLCVAGWIFIGLSWMAGCLSAIQGFYTKPRMEKDNKSVGSRANSATDNGVNRVNNNRALARVYSIDSGYAGNNGVKQGNPYHRQASFDSVYNNTSPNPIEKDMDEFLNEKDEDIYLTKL